MKINKKSPKTISLSKEIRQKIGSLAFSLGLKDSRGNDSAVIEKAVNFYYSFAKSEKWLKEKEPILTPKENLYLETELVKIIGEAEKAKKLLSEKRQARLFIGDIRLQNPEGGLFSETDILLSVDKLCQEGKLRIICGQRNGNGLILGSIPEENVFE